MINTSRDNQTNACLDISGCLNDRSSNVDNIFNANQNNNYMYIRVEIKFNKSLKLLIKLFIVYIMGLDMQLCCVYDQNKIVISNYMSKSAHFVRIESVNDIII